MNYFYFFAERILNVNDTNILLPLFKFSRVEVS